VELRKENDKRNREKSLDKYKFIALISQHPNRQFNPKNSKVPSSP